MNDKTRIERPANEKAEVEEGRQSGAQNIPGGLSPFSLACIDKGSGKLSNI